MNGKEILLCRQLQIVLGRRRRGFCACCNAPMLLRIPMRRISRLKFEPSKWLENPSYRGKHNKNFQLCLPLLPCQVPSSLPSYPTDTPLERKRKESKHGNMETRKQGNKETRILTFERVLSGVGNEALERLSELFPPFNFVIRSPTAKQGPDVRSILQFF